MEKKQLVVCYISGLDLRRIDTTNTTFLANQLERSAWRSYLNLPSNELFPTLVTGVDPSVHGVWGVQLTDDLPGALEPRLVDRCPDVMATFVQCTLHFLTNNYDLAAIPPRRRRRFRITRTKYKRRSKQPEALYTIGSVSTVLGTVGADQADYVFNSDEDPAKSVLKSLCREDKVLEVVELYSLDRYQQWNLDDEQSVKDAYAKVDTFLEQLLAKCQLSGKSLMIVSDHGHETITESFDLSDYLEPLNLTDNDYSLFTEVSSARFWFHNDRARNAVYDALRQIGSAELVTYQEMAQYSVPLSDSSYGELFCFLRPGAIFFPHDFYQPLANLYFGLTDRMQRSRLKDPRHRGNHGHLPHHEAERSFAMVAGSGFRACDNDPASILDVAPSILSLLDLPVPKSMTGRSLFERT